MKLKSLLLSILFSVSAFAQEQIMVTQNIAYDNHPSCVMDIAQPVSDSKDLRPAIVIVHGGGWSAGDKRNAKEPQLKTYLIMNAGMGTMEMAGASAKNLKELHAPIIYMSSCQNSFIQ